MAILVMYGGVAINREFCKVCNAYSLVVDGKLVCCDKNATEEADTCKREIQVGIVDRHDIPDSIKKAINIEQGGRCLYCDREFGSVVYRHGKPIVLRLHYDHKAPWAYVGVHTRRNICAACHVCNLIKSDMIFQTVEEASIYILSKREEKGYTDVR